MNNLSEALGALGDHAGARELHELVRDSAGPPGQLTARSHNRRSRAWLPCGLGSPKGIDLRHVLSAQLAVDVVVGEAGDEPDRDDEEHQPGGVLGLQHVR